MTNQDTDSNPKVDQWSNGVDQADELYRLMKVRRSALNRIGEHTIRAGAPLATIEEPLVPIYMYHRYAVESAASMIAGQDYIYGMRGDKRTPTKGVSVDDQRKALDALAATLRPAELTVPKPVLDLIPPRPPGYGMHRELFPRTTGDTFDPLSPATIAADVTIGFVLQLDRASRMVAQHAVNPALPGLEDVIDRLTAATFDAPTATPYEAAVRRAEERVLVDRVMWLAAASPNGQVRAIASLKLSKLAARLKVGGGEDGSGHGAAPAAGRRHQALPRAAARSHEADSVPGARRAARRADRRARDGLAGETEVVNVEGSQAEKARSSIQPRPLLLVTRREGACIMSPHVLQRAEFYLEGTARVSLLSLQENDPHPRAAWRAALLLRELRALLVDPGGEDPGEKSQLTSAF